MTPIVDAVGCTRQPVSGFQMASHVLQESSLAGQCAIRSRLPIGNLQIHQHVMTSTILYCVCAWL